ncbi:SCO family protein [Steroidobacter sp.]|uniref:SCO family protein n=1 Tax=Steroidobacter sp. TaxID=1978227 RepID=UPI001A4DD58B|nr:SCO family protein [Steroidobacter sp.]MBL8265351.1 SCO family protein [Steroidobacter sp.]
MWLLLVPVALLLGAGLAMKLRHSAPAVIPASFAGLIDQDGATADDRRFAGRYLLVSFGFTFCPDVCPTTLVAVHGALEKLGNDATQVAPVFVTVDPERDTAQRLKTYVASFDPRIHAFTGAPDAIAKVAEQFHVRYEKHLVPGASGYTVDHTALLYILDSERRLVASIPETSPQLSEKIVTALQQAWRK